MKFEVTAPDGRTLEIEGDSFPSESELDEIFAAVKPDIDYNKAKVNDIFSVDGLPSDAPSKLQELGTFLKEGVSKPFVQGYFQQAKGIGGIMNWYADQSRLSKESAEALGISEETRKKLNTFSDILNIAGDSVRFGAEEMLEKDWLKSDPEVFKGGFLENPSWTRASAAVASALPSIGSIVAFGKNNFALGYALLAGSENSDIYLEAKEKVGEEKASGLFLAGTAGTAAIDIAMQPVEKIIKPLTGSFIKRMGERAIRGGMEALPESMQQVFQNAVKKYGYDATQDLAEGVIESAIGGFGVGAIAAGSGKLLEQGATEEEVEQLQNIMAQAIVEDSEAINDIAYQDMKQTLNKINAKYANMPETERMRISRELEEGFGKYYEELSKIMPKEQAISNAALIRNSAFFMSDLMGISPKEYFDKYAPKIEKMEFDEFNGQKAQFEEVYRKMNEIDAEEFAKGVPEYTEPTININGIDKQTTNSNGEPIAKSKRSLEYFYNWFGDSKVVDEQGRPLVVYHGTSTEFDTFRKGNIFTTDNQEVASEYGSLGAMPLYIKLENPFIVDAYGQSFGEIYNAEGMKKAYKDLTKEDYKKLADTFFDGDIKEAKEWYPQNEQGEVNLARAYGEKPRTTNEWADYARKEGYDGVIIKDVNDTVDISNIRTTDYVAFNPNQIKSTSNRGTYSLDEDNIYYQYGGIEALTANLDALRQAQNMELNEASPEEIWRETGWKHGKDGKWRFEISDDEAIVDFSNTPTDVMVTLGDVLSHEKLYKAYPYLKNLPVLVDSSLKGSPSGAQFISGTYDEKYGWLGRKIQVNPDVLNRKDISLKEIMMHEVQHAIQRKEGFATGGSPSFFADPENKKIFEKLFQEEDTKKFNQAVLDFLYEEVSIDNANKISDVDDRLIVASKNMIEAIDTPQEADAEQVYDDIKEELKKALEEAGKTEDWLADIKTKARKKAGVDLFGKSLRAKLYSPYDLYLKLYGEEEAFSTQERSKMTEEERRASFPTEDSDAIVTFDDGTVMAYEPEVIQKFYQNEQSPQGAYANDMIYLFENANESTLPHELSHRWDREVRTIAEETGNERAKAMLEQVDAWEESEFKRKFNVIKRDNGYAIVNKKGDVVYDNRGSGFLTEQDAKDYAKRELFSRGFEQYLREGKAPNNSLKQAFRNFFMWLKKIYRDAMDLNIQLSPDIKNVYADILGGTDIDFFLESTPESFIQQRIKLGQERETYLDGIIQDAVANKKQVVKNKSGKGFSEVWAKAMIPLSTRAKRISPKLRNVLRKYEFTLSNELNKKYAKVTPFMNIWKNMEENDAITFDLALKNDYVAKQLEIVDKYNARKEWEAVRGTLEQIYDEAINAGLDINWRPDYFPRKVKDVDGFLSYIHNMPEWTRFQQAIDEAGLSGATAEEQAEFLNKYLRGFVKVDLMPNKYGSEKQRTIDIIDNEMNKFYAPSIEALVGYIEGLNSRVVSANYLGKGENIDESIGGYLTYLLNNNIIEPSQIDEVRDILRARFDARGVSNRWLANARNYSYMYTMGGINSAITQIEDLSVAMYKAGVWNTLTTAMKAKRVTKQDLGLTSISAEFVEQSKSGELLNKLFKLTGLDAIDGLGKETLVNAELKKFQKMSDETLREYLEPIMENETEATIKDIKNDVISDNVLYLMFSELSDVQPISLSELPEFYNRGGNLRVLYMLKSFAVKRIDTFRNECIDKIKSKDLATRKEGLQNLFKLASLMILCGATKDWLIDLMYGRETDISERLLNNILGLVGISKFQIYQAKEKGFTGTVKDLVVPPLFSFFDDLFTDTVKVAEGKREIKDMEVLKGIPLVGRFYYWWVGRGREKSKGKKKKY